MDLILTDPPYAREYEPLYEDMAELGAKVLRTGGSLVTLCGHFNVPELCQRMGKYLRYWWIGGIRHTRYKRLPGKWVTIMWKPALWFVNGRRFPGDTSTPFDMIAGDKPDKEFHKWGQPVNWFEHWIDNLCPDPGTVLDPFLGGGTTLVAARNQGVSGIGIEVDPEAAAIAADRLGLSKAERNGFVVYE